MRFNAIPSLVVVVNAPCSLGEKYRQAFRNSGVLRRKEFARSEASKAEFVR
jgi:hypothetical protein